MSEAVDRFIVGCGYLGRRVAGLWRDAGLSVAALTRSRAAEFAAAGLTPVVGDVVDPSTLGTLPAAGCVLYAVGLDRSAGHDMRSVYVDGLRNVLDALPRPRRLIYVSSVSVYGETGGGVVTEETPTEPGEGSGRIVLDAERLVRERVPGAVILRFAGIYGPGRLLRERATRAGEPISGRPDRWLNLIEVRDGARAAVRCDDDAVAGKTINVSDGSPVRRGDFYNLLAELLDAPEPTWLPADGADLGKRVDSGRLMRELGFTFEYASYRQGLPAALRDL